MVWKFMIVWRLLHSEVQDYIAKVCHDFINEIPIPGQGRFQTDFF